jgi:RNA polymerase sigma-70 factor (ECF subfamily)
MAYSEDARFVARVIAGDERAFEEFIFTYRRLILGILRRQAGLRPDEADEVFQRFLIHVWERDFARLKAWRGRSSLSTYLATMARNLGRDFRRACPVLSAEAIDDRPNLTEPNNDDRIAALECAMRQLGPRDRELLRRRYELDHSYREIANGLGMTANNVGVALLRAERRLKSLMGL